MRQKILFCIILSLIYSGCTNKPANQMTTTPEIKWTIAKEFISTTTSTVNDNELIRIFENTLNKIISEKLISSEDVLAYIDGTNGLVSFYGNINGEKNHPDTTFIEVLTPDLWEQHLDNSFLYDETIKLCVKSAFLKTRFGSKKTLFVQDELGERIKLD